MQPELSAWRRDLLDERLAAPEATPEAGAPGKRPSRESLLCNEALAGSRSPREAGLLRALVDLRQEERALEVGIRLVADFTAGAVVR